MPSDYAAIRRANKAEYGNVGRWGRDILGNRYDSSAHFIFELLQNAEDALKRRNGWSGSREVRFELTPTCLRIVHYGNPFTLEDVKGVCGVGETTKDGLFTIDATRCLGCCGLAPVMMIDDDVYGKLDSVDVIPGILEKYRV